jgi:hypothetical protein
MLKLVDLALKLKLTTWKNRYRLWVTMLSHPLGLYPFLDLYVAGSNSGSTTFSTRNNLQLFTRICSVSSMEGLKMICVAYCRYCNVSGQNERLSFECRFQDRYIKAIIIIYLFYYLT